MEDRKGGIAVFFLEYSKRGKAIHQGCLAAGKEIMTNTGTPKMMGNFTKYRGRDEGGREMMNH